ncbi:MAG TPA: exodeoxyribonuclease V subunit alpha [Oleiagrimonas sp.]|nr:exodeoxyribonuclease V subunit alpha [Oleiagrimonas sp.]
MNASSDPHRANLVDRLEVDGALRPLDAELGRLMHTLDPSADEALMLTAAVVSLAVSQGHSCLPLDALPEVLATAMPGDKPLPTLPTPQALREALGTSALVGDPNTPADARLPLWLDAGERLYLGRHSHYEMRVAEVLRRLATRPTRAGMDATVLRQLLSRHYKLEGSRPDWQAVAVATGLLSGLTVITGGPGTGKTTTVLRLLVALLDQATLLGVDAPRMALAAPTGKAAARMSESIGAQLPRMDLDASLREQLDIEASTIHRLLGVRAGSSRFRHDRRRPLDVDVLVIDEASMVDLPLMAKLLDALPEHASLVLLGDRDQLASVEAGNVLAGMCAAAGNDGVSARRAQVILTATGFDVPVADTANALSDSVIALRDSYRFTADSGLGQLATHVRDGKIEPVLKGLRDDGFAGVTRVVPRAPEAHVLAHVGDRFAALAGCESPADALASNGTVRVLTALRDGPSGCVAINAVIEQWLRQKAHVPARTRWYPGRLIMVVENDVGSGLFNGDIGIAMPDTSGRMAVHFPSGSGGVRSLPVQALPAHETAFAMTIHKSQGSEFDEVVLVLPPTDARVLGRELLYTGITRARERVCLLANDAVIDAAISRSTRRYGGLADRLASL